MKEDFLHYVWRFQKFNTHNLVLINGAALSIIKTGEPNINSGPDFFNSKVLIANQLWVGTVEIHLKSSDWYAHHHEQDPNYDTVILHVVWDYDTDVFRKDNSSIPTLVLRSKVDPITLTNYQNLFSKKLKWINCENEISKINPLIIDNWLDRLYLERLQEKSVFIQEELNASNNHWERLLFKLLCKNFGLNVNGASFYSISKSVDYKVIQKCFRNHFELEALLFGQAGFFEEVHEDSYFIFLKEKYGYLKSKFKLENKEIIRPKYFRLRPINFPSIRLSQLAVLFSEKPSLFSEIIIAKTQEDFYSIFNATASEYWDTHYNFGIPSSKRKKRMTKKFIDLLLINTVIPLIFSYSMFQGKDKSEEIIALTSAISSEENSIIKKFNLLYPFSKNALQSQALLQLKKKYCDNKKCLECSIGNSILKG